MLDLIGRDDRKLSHDGRRDTLRARGVMSHAQALRIMMLASCLRR